MPRIAMHSRRSRPSCSVIALATVLAVGATPATAKSFNGTGTYVTNPVVNGIDDSVAGITTITLNPGQTVLNWVPDDNATNTTANILFQNSGTTATFTSTGDFAVLNNIDSASFTRAIQMDGTVRARVNSVQRGSVYFYAPGGFVFGGGSSFSVGSLVVSALPIAFSANGFIGNWGTENNVVFGPAENPNAAIASQGAISANVVTSGFPSSANSSYVALVAPRVHHTGAISVNGSAALVAAEAATMSFSPDGLFDIEVTVGSDPRDPNNSDPQTNALNPINVTGDIGGPSPSAVDKQHRVYLVAIPKNDAVTMVIGNGADLGFTLANNASIDQYGAVVLSAGHDIENGLIGDESAGSNAPANFWFTGAHATNNLFGKATGFAELYSVDPNLTTTFDSDVTVDAIDHITMNASGIEASLTVGGNLDLSTDITGGAGESVTAGTITLQSLNGATVSVGGSTTLSADATGGSSGSGTAGSGTGGEIWVNAVDGGSLTLQSVTGTAHGTGGAGLAAGVHAGQGTGGTVRLYGHTGSTVVVNGAVSYDAKGTGGAASGAGLAGTGHGGGAYVYIGDDSFVTINGATTLKSDGQGGAHASGNGGLGSGGESRVTSVAGSVTNGLLTFNGNVELSSDGTGGASNGAGTGGTGDGGWARISTPLGSTVDLNGTANLHADGTGGDSEAGNGGFGQGGLTEIESLAGNIDISGAVTMLANGLGGESLAEGATAGDGTGGDINIRANAGTSIIFQGHVAANADGDGGLVNPGVNGGDGTGGDINVSANGTGGTLTFLQGADIFADGEGSFPAVSECLVCSAIGGDGFGGTVTFTGTSGGLVNATGIFELSATGSGGSGGSGAAGNGTGGTVLVSAPTGVTMNFTGELQLNGSGDGGFGELGNAAGNGTGKSALLHVDGGTVTVTGELQLDADGFGGESGGGGSGGTGTGGVAEILTTGSTAQLDVFGNVLVEADGVGGDSEFNFFEGPLGDGGDGFGGQARVIAADGSIHITGNLVMDATSTGGTGAIGGDAAGILTPDDGEDLPPAAMLWAGGTTAELRVDGLTDIDVSATGGDGFDGNGGNGSGGEIDIASRDGDIVLGDLIGNAEGIGGNGSFGGGDGGDGTGGAIDVNWSVNQDTGLSGSISIETAALSANGYGGNGGDGFDGFNGTAGGNGGDGGDGTGGGGTFVGSAGGGTFSAGATTITASGIGGNGGNGGSSDTGVGGSGGDGGNGSVVGFIQTGTVSNDFSPTSGGTATFADLSVSSSATGGDGGNGGVGGTGTGAGGNGGSAAAGSASFLVRGIPVTAGTVNLFASATGGNGGSGSTAGNGGNATAGFVSAESKERFGDTDQRGSLIATAINGTAIAQGGTGTTPGTSTVRGGSFFRIWNGDANIGSVNFNIAGNLYDGTLGPDYIQVQDGDAVVGNFTFSTTGQLAIYTAQMDADIETMNTLTATNLTLSAGNFIDHPTLVGPTTPGTIFATTMSVTTGNNFFADANFDVVNDIDISAPGSIRFDNARSDSSVDLFANSGSIDVGNIDAAGFVHLDAGTFILGKDIDANGSIVALSHNGDITLEDLNTFSSILLNAAGDINVSGDMFADGDIVLTADGLIDMNNANAGFFMADAGTSFFSEDILSDLNIIIDAGTSITTGNLTAGVNGTELTSMAIRLNAGGAILVEEVIADGGIDFEAGTTINGGNVTSGQEFHASAGGNVTLENLSGGLVNPQGPTEDGFSVTVNSGGSVDVGTIAAAESVGLVAAGTLVALDISAGDDVLGLVHGNMDIGDIDAGGRVYLADSSMFTDAGGDIGGDGNDLDPEVIFNDTTPTRTGGSITVDDVLAGSFTAAAGTSLTTGFIDTDSEIALDANGAITTGDLFAGDFVLANGGSITTQNIEADSVDMTSTGGDITINGDIFAFGAVELDAFGDILTGDITAGSIDLLAGDDITTDNLTTQFLVLLEQEGPITPLLFPGASITLESGGDIATDNIDSIDGVYANAGGSLTTGTIGAVDFVALHSGGNMQTLAINADDLFAEAGGTMGLGALDIGFDVELFSVGNMSFGNAIAGSVFDFSSEGSVTGQSIVAGLTIEGETAGNVTLGNLTAGFDPGEGSDDDIFSVGIVSAGTIDVDDVEAAGAVGFATLSNLITGDISAGELVMALVQGNITTGAITTTGESGGQVYMAHASMCETGGGCSSETQEENETDFDPNLVLAEDPVPTGGSITINGQVDTGLLRAAAGTSLTTQAVNAEDVSVFAGGLATINGAWSVGDAKVISNDIDITANGSISADGDISLVSKNATRTIVGDGVNLAGYNVSNGEYGRLSANDINIIADTAEGAAPTMLIGTLNVDAGDFPEGIDYGFFTGNSDSEISSGSIRVVGNAVFNGMTSEDHSVNFATDRFELDASTGSLSLFSSGSTLGGELGLYADRIHVAETSILNQLASNPTYTNYQQDLNESPDVQRPEGVLRADTIWIESENLQDVLIQNMGSGFQGGTPAGFVVRQAFINDDQEVAGPPGSINLIVNGQVVTEGGTLTGVAARDALITPEDDITPFTSNSTINGCPLTGACIIAPPPPPPTVDIVDNFIDLLGSDSLGDSDFGNEDDIDDNEEGDEGANNPISPPQPLFDTRPLIPSGDVNDPVSGTGNPALLGSDQQCEEDEQGQCPANPVKGDSQ